MSVGTKCRKRTREESNECIFANQNKYFINQQIIDQNDANKMKEIHDKTIKLLFKNANNKVQNDADGGNAIPNKMEQFRNNICLMGNGVIDYIVDIQKNPSVTDKTRQRKCNYCLKMSNILVVGCINCNAEMCEFCGISCLRCNEPLCMSCVNVFGCCDNTSNACCESCKLIHNI